MLPEDGEELLQRLSSEMGLPDFMDDVSMDMETYIPPSMREDDMGSDSPSSSEAEYSSTGGGGGLVSTGNRSDFIASNYSRQLSEVSTDVDAVAADLLSSGVLDQIMVEEFSKSDADPFSDQDTKEIDVNNTYGQLISNVVQHDGK